MKDWRRLLGKRVVVVASGVEYRGVVVELGVRAVVLRAATGMREVPWDRISRVSEDRGTAPGRR